MSNQQVGVVFEKVIQEVCDSSQVDFEESGVDQQTLHDLRETWQKKLSSVNVAHFPWDPAPVQPTQNAIHPPATVPSNAPRPPPQQQQQYIPPPVSIPQHAPVQMQAPMAMGGPRIKTEPGSNGQPPMPQMAPQMTPQMPPHGMNPQSARDRAATALQQRYGAAAASSVSQMQAQAQAGQGYPQMHPNAHGQMPHIKQEHGYPPMGGQTDGGDDPLTDWKAEVARRRAAAQSGQGDHLLREFIKQRMSEYEGGGLMRPLDEHESSAKLSRRAVISLGQDAGVSSAPRLPGQVDGADGDVKEEDEDAINSDLDDPDDLVADDHDADESEGQVMLCTYDKVQRVKNKWKCTLKDGILTSGGKEYVFHKGQGEFEW
ncbi:unnamed protein product [Penicillium olsonii]|nr:unnamed protein product [Penicillium olsonii]CAG7930193.1 unnamed protein product [Penicillium olsonii]